MNTSPVNAQVKQETLLVGVEETTLQQRIDEYILVLSSQL